MTRVNQARTFYRRIVTQPSIFSLVDEVNEKDCNLDPAPIQCSELQRLVTVRRA